MSISTILQNTRCFICGSVTFKTSRMQILIRGYCATAESEEIVIPKRIKRGPTDILKALATTIRRDPTAPHYKFHDDPYLIPVSNYTKRIFSLSQESGRKTAMWVREQHPELFQHRVADPPIEAFLPKAVYDETDDVGNETLSKVIKSASVNNAITVYELMLKAGKDVTPANKQALLELLCFFNETEEMAEELIEERWYSQAAVKEQQHKRKTWKDHGYVERIFKELPPSGESYSALIQGMVKFNQFEKAYDYFNIASQKGFVLSVHAYNAILYAATFLKQSADERWSFIEGIMKLMNEQGHLPNLQTLNAVLSTLLRMRGARDCKRFALKMIAEVKQFGVEPSLGSYHFLLNIFCNMTDQRTRCYILEDILDHIEGKEFHIQDASDPLFFGTAMELCRFYLKDINLAYRVNDLLWHGKNYNLIGNSYREAVYYRNFFVLLLQSEDLDTIMKLYNYYVPNIYTPEMSVIEEFVKTITMNGAVNLYPKVWTDIVMFEMADKLKLLALLLNGMVLNSPLTTSLPTDTTIQLGETAWSIYSKVEDVSMNKIPLEWTGEMLGDILLLCLRADNYERAVIIFQKLNTDESRIQGVPSFEPFTHFMNACIKNQDVHHAMKCISYCCENGYGEVMSIAKHLVKNLHLSPSNTTHLVALLGQDVLKDDTEVQENTAISA